MRAKRLGRGLSNLIQSGEEATAIERRMRTGSPDVPPGDGASELPLARIRANPFQPRARFDDGALGELTDSIRAHGVLQPVVVRRAEDGAFELIAGERRVRAARAAGLAAIPALVRSASDQELQTLALVENLQREDLNAIEKARALQAMMRNFDWTQEDVARRVGKARTTIANLLRLLELPDEILGMVEDGTLSGAHARAVLQAKGTERRLVLARLAAAQGLSVREVERRARSGPTVGKRKARAEDPYVRDLERRLRESLSTDVRLKTRGQGGTIEVRYDDPAQLDRLLDLMGA